MMIKYEIPEFPGYYITQDGQVWSNKSNRFLTTGKHVDGYAVVGMFKHKKVYSSSIARLLLTTFVRPPLPGEEARHLNDIKTDDELSNLAWGTHKQNGKDMIRNGHSGVGERNGNSKLFPLDIINILYLCQEKQKAQTEIAKMYGVTQSMISYINLGKFWKNIYVIWNSGESG